MTAYELYTLIKNQPAKATYYDWTDVEKGQYLSALYSLMALLGNDHVVPKDSDDYIDLFEESEGAECSNAMAKLQMEWAVHAVQALHWTGNA